MTAEFLGALPRQTGPEICCRFRWEGRSICRPVAAGDGFSLMNRLQIGRRYRLTPEEVLTAVTLNAAAAIGLAGRIGSLEPGKLANVLLLDEELNIHTILLRGRMLG